MTVEPSIRTSLRTLALVVLALVLGAGPALATDGNLPGGTSISVDIVTPTDGAVKVSPPGQASLSGTAGVGTAPPVPSTAIIYVIDVSGSTGAAGGACGTILACEKAAALALNAQAVATGTVGFVAVVSFSTVAAVNLGFTLPNSPAVATAINGLGAGGATSFGAGLNAAVSLLPPPAGITSTIIVFMSDGLHNTAPGVGVGPLGVLIQAFAVGGGSNCTSGGGDSLNALAARGTAGSGCTQVTDPNNLPAVVPGVISSQLVSVSLSVDGGPSAPLATTPGLPQAGPVNVAFGPVNVPLTPGVHQLCVTASGTDGGGAGSVTECITVTIVTISLTPPFVINELGTPGQTHTVTATLSAGGPGVPGQNISLQVVAGPNAGASNPGPTDANGQRSLTYTAAQGPAGLGTDLIQACFGPDEQGDTICAAAKKLWRDTTPPRVSCVESVNPHGKNIPPAGRTTLPGPKGGQNEDGFYQLNAKDAVDPDPEIFVGTAASPGLFGPFASGTVVKITQADGATPSIKNMGSSNGQAGAVTAHITLNDDAFVTAVDDSGNVGSVTCLVPRPPK